MCCSAGHGPLILQMIQVVTKPSIPRALSLPEIVCVCLSMIICQKHLITSILHIIIRMLFWVGIGILELRIKVLAKFADQLTQSCPNFGSLGIGTRLGSGWVRRQRRISEFLILVTFKETFTHMLFVWISGSDRANKKICRFIRQSRRFVNSSY